MLIIYTPHITNRILYTIQYIFNERLGIAYSITDNKEEYVSANSALKIGYDVESLGVGVFVHSSGLLCESDIKKINLYESTCDDIKTLFPHNNEEAVLNFDIFSAIFYLLTRYEEYLGEPFDRHGNFNYRNSILYKLDILDTPVIEQWIELFKEVLIKHYPALEFKKNAARFCLTFDIDIAYAYKYRSIARTIGGFANKVMHLNIKDSKNQLLTLMNKQQDAFDTYNYIFKTIKNKKPVFFFNMGVYGRFDKNPSFRNKHFRQLIRTISEKAEIGVHPSYASNTNKNFIAIEKKKLESITENAVTASRQHYLKLKLPGTYNNLISNNITRDFTIGYSGYYGFRAGTCNDFLFFDLVKNETTDLRLYPFSYMDVTLNNYLSYSIEEAKESISKLINIICLYKGIFIPLWHNSTLCNCNEWIGWREVLEHTITEIDNHHMQNIIY
jgi:hypothetical protein